MSKQNGNDNKKSIETHPEAIYTSRLLNFKNLPEPKNADDDTTKINKKLSNATKITNTSSKNAFVVEFKYQYFFYIIHTRLLISLLYTIHVL